MRDVPLEFAMRHKEFRQEAMDPQTPRERLAALVDNAPEVHDALILNPKLPEDLRDYLIESSPIARNAWNRHLENQRESQHHAALSHSSQTLAARTPPPAQTVLR